MNISEPMGPLLGKRPKKHVEIVRLAGEQCFQKERRFHNEPVSQPVAAASGHEAMTTGFERNDRNGAQE